MLTIGILSKKQKWTENPVEPPVNIFAVAPARRTGLGKAELCLPCLIGRARLGKSQPRVSRGLHHSRPPNLKRREFLLRQCFFFSVLPSLVEEINRTGKGRAAVMVGSCLWLASCVLFAQIDNIEFG